jgi:RNA polymerase sigma-70 factor (ECF subfamily)
MRWSESDFERVRPRLFGIAYRMLRRPADAEDVLQDVWIRWQRADPERVRDPVGFLVTVTKRTALNAATCAYARRECSAGSTLTERDLAAADPATEAERDEAIERAIHLLMERLSPVERAVYLLREAFQYPFRDIAEELQLSDVYARQVARRARRHLAEQRHHRVDPAANADLLHGFLGAARAGHMARLIDLLAAAP